MRRAVPFLIPVCLFLGGRAFAAAPEPSLVSFSSGALIVQAPAEYGSGWSAFWMLDEKPDSGWASPEGVLTPAVTVIALPEKTVLKRLEFDTAGIDGDGRVPVGNKFEQVAHGGVHAAVAAGVCAFFLKFLAAHQARHQRVVDDVERIEIVGHNGAGPAADA